MNFKALSLFCAAALTTSANAALTLPPPDPNGGYSGTNGDFEIYSLPIMQLVFENDNNLNSGDLYHIPSAPGEISSPGDYVVIGTFPNAAQDNGDVSPLMDDAYQLTNGGGANSESFSMDTLADPDPAFTGDLADSWDANLQDLVNFTGTTDLVVFFNFNELNSDGFDFGDQFLQAWVHVWITDESTGANLGDWYLTGDDADGTARNPAGPGDDDFNMNGDPLEISDLTDPNADWANAFGNICLNTTTGVGDPGCQFLNPNDADVESVDHNLGADNAAYVITSQALNTFVASQADLSNLVLHVDWRQRFSDNGYEQAFFMAGTAPPTDMPEPNTIALVGAALFLGATARRRRSAK